MAQLKIRYTKEQKLAIVNESMDDGVKLSDLAERYGLHVNTIRRWRREHFQYEHNAFPGKGIKKQTDEQREIERLKKALREAELANEILKKAMGIVASPNRRNLLS